VRADHHQRPQPPNPLGLHTAAPQLADAHLSASVPDWLFAWPRLFLDHPSRGSDDESQEAQVTFSRRGDSDPICVRTRAWDALWDDGQGTRTVRERDVPWGL
jgi:hypothetical protein